MATQTYCTRTELEEIAAQHGIDAFVDDDRDGLVSTTEETYVTAAIRRAASKINFKLARRYKQSDLVGNDFLKDANAWLGICEIMRRRANPQIDSWQSQCDEFTDMLDEIQAERADIPGLVESIEHIGTVSNHRPERWRGTMKARVSRQESTGADPQESRKRKTSIRKRDGS